MQPLLGVIVASALLGFWSHGKDSPVPRGLLLGLSMLLAVALYSRRLL